MPGLRSTRDVAAHRDRRSTARRPARRALPITARAAEVAIMTIWLTTAAWLTVGAGIGALAGALVNTLSRSKRGPK